MKINKSLFGLMAAAALTLTSCDINKTPEFSDSDAFVAFASTTASVEETGGSIELPVTLASINGLSGTVDFEISAPETAGAKQGVHYTVEGASQTLTFTKEESTQYIKINVIDNDIFEGDVRLVVTLTNPQGLNIGASKSCTLTIVDDEHPLAFLFGTYNAVGYDYFSSGAEEEWVATIEKDASDISRVWITGIVSGGVSAAYPVYGTVTSDNSEIHIPVNQYTAVSSSYDVYLEGFRNEGEEDITDYIVGTIATDASGKVTITFEDWMGAHAYSAGTTTSAGWYAIEMGAVFTKQ